MGFTCKEQSLILSSEIGSYNKIVCIYIVELRGVLNFLLLLSIKYMTTTIALTFLSSDKREGGYVTQGAKTLVEDSQD